VAEPEAELVAQPNKISPRSEEAGQSEKATGQEKATGTG